MVTARQSRPTALGVWINGQRVGNWWLQAGEHRFQYADEWLVAAAGRRLSLSLPFTPGNVPHRGPVVQNYFDNLLPDSDHIRRRLQDRFATASNQAFDLLAAIGRDCVGAVQLLPKGHEPAGFDRIEATPLDATGIERVIDAALTPGRALGHANDSGFRISIAGAQEKTALLRLDGRWQVPIGATPTTHILKLPLGLVGNMRADMHGSVENEGLCARVLAAFGLPVARCNIANFGQRKVLVVERFDRAIQEPRNATRWIARLPQEDFCQALGVSGTRKYEADGGPGIQDLLRVLDGSNNATADKRAFLKAQMLFWMLAATDGHAKNFSIFLERGGGYRLTPFYNVLSAWPIIGRAANQIDWRKARLAMAVRGRNAHWRLTEILPRHWDGVARLAGLGDASAIRREILDRLPSALDELQSQLPRGFPAQVAASIFDGLRFSARRLAVRA